MADMEFIQTTVNAMLEGKNSETRMKILGLANQYCQVFKFPMKLTDYNDKQLDKYFGFIEKLSDMPEVFTQESFEKLPLIEKVSSIMGEVTEIEIEGGENSSTINGVINKLSEAKKYRDDLKCPYCGQMVYDNRNNKKSDKSPDFVCSTNDPAICGGHSGKWRKSWWMDNNDIPEDWNLNEGTV
tara:strand:- start:2379 stop:2930 length:552 start_codon:yes stop_codon:yes gene_type:complete